MFITLIFLVVAKKSKTFFSLPYSATVQVCRRWEGARPGSQPKLASGNIPYHGRHAQFINGGWLGAVIGSSLFCEFESSLIWELELIQEFDLFWEFCKICEFWFLGD